MTNLLDVIRSLLAALTALLATAGAPATAADPLLCALQDERLTESSGVAVGRDVLWTHNDSGDSARFFALDRRCRTVGTFTVAGATATDWEDMARGAGALWFGDIGDNASTRAEIAVWRVPEPGTRGTRTVTGTRYRLAYADGAHDAETLLVHPRTGRLFVVTKSYTGTSAVYAAPARLGPGLNTLTRVASFQTRPTGTAGGPAGPLGQLSTTGGDVSPAADRVVVRTYTDAYEWVVPGGDVAAAFAGTPTVTALPETGQGEAIAYDSDGRSWVTTSEGRGAPVHRVVRAG